MFLGNLSFFTDFRDKFAWNEEREKREEERVLSNFRAKFDVKHRERERYKRSLKRKKK